MLQREVFGDLWRGSAGMFGTLLAAVSAKYEQGSQFFGINPFLQSDISFIMGIIIGVLTIISLLYRISESRSKAAKEKEEEAKLHDPIYPSFKKQKPDKVKTIAKSKEDDYYK